MKWKSVLVPALLAAPWAAVFANPKPPSTYSTEIKPYAVSVSPYCALQPLLSVGDRVPETGAPSDEYQLVGLPEGMGTQREPNNTAALYMSHELLQTDLSEPRVGGPLSRGAFVSKFVLDNRTGGVISGGRAYATVFQENTLVGPAAEDGNATPGFAGFSSGSLSQQDAGFDRAIYLAGENAIGTGTFDGLGGQCVAVFGGEAHALPKLGHMAWKSAVVRPRTGAATVILGLEGGALTTPDSQLFLYAGAKDSAALTPLGRNGLDNGKLYVLVPSSPSQTTEAAFTSGTLNCQWVEIPGADLLNDAALEAAADAAGAFGFIRLGDGAFEKKNPNRFFFVSTGGGTGNLLGRVYELQLNTTTVLGPCTLRLVVNADEVAADEGDTAFSPEGVEVADRYLVVSEDGNEFSQPEYTARAREGSMWRFDLWDNFRAERIVELNPPGTDTAPVLIPGTWECTGVVDAFSSYGLGSAIFSVQAHAPTVAPALNTVEDGQLFLLRQTFPGRSATGGKGGKK